MLVTVKLEFIKRKIIQFWPRKNLRIIKRTTQLEQYQGRAVSCCAFMDV
jgi:hypothetical protein